MRSTARGRKFPGFQYYTMGERLRGYGRRSMGAMDRHDALAVLSRREMQGRYSRTRLQLGTKSEKKEEENPRKLNNK